MTFEDSYIAVDKITTRVHMNPREALGSLEHVRNKSFREREAHIDGWSNNFEVWKDESIYDIYNEIFGEHIRKYNERQKIKSRRILDANGDAVGGYIQSIQTSKRGKKERVVYKNVQDGTKEAVGKRQESQGQRVLYELIISAGNCEKKRDERGRIVYTDDGHEIHPMRLPQEVNKAAIKRFFKEFETLYPHLKLTTAAFHGDEFYINEKGVKEFGIEHGHLCFVPWADGYTRGLPVQASISKALQQMGFKNGKDKDGVWHNAYWFFTMDAQEKFENILQHEYVKYQKEHGVTLKGYGIYSDMGCVPGLDFIHPVKGKNHANLDPARYRELKETEGRLNAVQNELDAKSDELDAVRAELDAVRDEYTRTDGKVREAEVNFAEIARKHKIMCEECERLTEDLEDYKKRTERITEKDFKLDIPFSDVQNWMEICTITVSDTRQKTTIAKRCREDLARAREEKIKENAKAAKKLQEEIRDRERRIAETVQKALGCDTEEDDTEYGW